jgi:hypothetical protein
MGMSQSDDHEAGTDDRIKFVSGTLSAREVRPMVVRASSGPAALGLAVALPAGEQPDLDRLVAKAEGQQLGVIDIFGHWRVMNVGANVLARLDLHLTGSRLTGPVEARILFDVKSAGAELWAVALSRRLMLLREAGFHDRLLEMESVQRATGLEISGIPGCDVLAAALERAGVRDAIFNGRFITE